MTTNHDPDRVERYLHDYMLFLDGEGAPPRDDHLDDAERAELDGKLALLRPLGSVTPRGSKYRIARMLGLDRASATIAIDGTKLKAERQRAHMELKDLAAAVTAVGCALRAGHLLQVEKQGDARLDQEIVTVIVAVLRITVADIEATFDADVPDLARILDGARVAEVIASWADDHARDADALSATVRAKVLGAAFRAEAITEDQVIDIVQALLRSMER